MRPVATSLRQDGWFCGSVADGTSVATLYRNLKAGVYGPTGSTRREVAEVALELRLAERSLALQEGTTENATALDRRVEHSVRTAQR